MPLTLSTAQQQTVSIDAVEINSFSVDLDNNQIHISYDELSGSTAINKDRLLTVGPTDFVTVLTDAENSYTSSVYGALKAALYNYLQTATGLSGTVS